MNVKKILIIDDEKDFCFLVSSNLVATGKFAVAYATDSNEGIRLARKDPPDLILLDIRMPRRDGFEVLKILKKKYEDRVYTCCHVECGSG